MFSFPSHQNSKPLGQSYFVLFYINIMSRVQQLILSEQKIGDIKNKSLQVIFPWNVYVFQAFSALRRSITCHLLSDRGSPHRLWRAEISHPALLALPSFPYYITTILILAYIGLSVLFVEFLPTLVCKLVRAERLPALFSAISPGSNTGLST